MQDFVILVDENDQQIGVEEKLSAHQSGKLHRAFSILLFNKNGELLLQQRALEKYHSPGLWTNTCCSHPRPGETNDAAAQRRLFEELGIQCKMDEIFDFIYKTSFDDGLFEHELDHVFVGEYTGDVAPNPEEVMAVRWQSLKNLYEEVNAHPERFTVWFKIMLVKIAEFKTPLSPAHAHMLKL
ncbi:MAG: isopentenyl-diphosphate Delta-isomerase [Deferribacteres bacterium]|nr:isopentenyl-diphosphate Delta-isomerase [candidate division KSB1 bacterium]MCB9503845.1 isopentenyl-diphosphate Delta-isomerase [Deferribacteres bacterium]